MNMNYADPDDAVNQQQVTSFDNKNHIPMSYVSNHINTATYNKNDRRSLVK